MIHKDLLPFKISECTQDFLKILTEVNSYFINPPYQDQNRNWFMGKKLTAMNIIESFISECKNGHICPEMPKCCEEYIKEINLQEVKEYKAYFIWENKGSRKNTLRKMILDYYEACEYILNNFCDLAISDINSCPYHQNIIKILKSNCGLGKMNQKESNSPKGLNI